MPSPLRATHHMSSFMCSFRITKRLMESSFNADYDNEQKALEAQLGATIREDLVRALQDRRPLLTHLNADTSWLLSLPIPKLSESKKQKLGWSHERDEYDVATETGIGSGTGNESVDRKSYFHILIDPWLQGSQSDVAQFFSQQWHAHESAVQTIEELEGIISELEYLGSSSPSARSSSSLWRSSIDAVVVSHEFTDHMHKATLLDVSASVPVFASSKAAGIIRSWHHFAAVVTLPTNLTARTRDWRATSISPLPPWLGISRLGVDKVDLLYYHSAVMFAFRSGDDRYVGRADEAEAVIYTPHGITPEDVQFITTAQPPIRTLALMHGLHDIRIGPQLNLGAHNGLKVQRLTKAKYWVSTHDEVKRGGGFVSLILRREVLSVKEALEREIQQRGGKGDTLDNVHFAELGNGETLLLE